MYKLRVLISLLFFWVIIFWFWKWLQKETIQQENTATLMNYIQRNLVHITQRDKNSTEAWGNNQSKYTSSLHPDILTGTSSIHTIKQITQWKVIISNERAQFELVIICDFSSYYCMQLFAGNLINELIDFFWKNLQISFVWFAQTWQNTHNAHHAYNCLNATYASWIRYQLIDILFNHTNSSLLTIAQATEWLAIPWFLWCLLNPKNITSDQSTFQAKLIELFPLTHLPSLIFYNKNTEQWYLIPWLYNLDELEESLSLMRK